MLDQRFKTWPINVTALTMGCLTQDLEVFCGAWYSGRICKERDLGLIDTPLGGIKASVEQSTHSVARLIKRQPAFLVFPLTFVSFENTMSALQIRSAEHKAIRHSHRFTLCTFHMGYWLWFRQQSLVGHTVSEVPEGVRQIRSIFVLDVRRH